MDNFFDELKNNLNSRPEPEFEDSAWLAMEQKMQPQKKGKRYIGGLWLMLLTIPLLFSYGYSYFKIKEAKVAINEMKIQILRDTIYTTRTVYIRDTIYQNNPVVVSESSKSPSQFNPSFRLTSFSSQSPFFNIKDPNNSFTYHTFKNNSSTSRTGIFSFSNSSRLLAYRNNSIIDSNSEPVIDKNDNIDSRNLKVVLLSSLEIGFVESNQQFPIEMNLQEVAILKKNKWRKRRSQIVNMMRPKSFQFGLGGGYIYPTN